MPIDIEFPNISDGEQLIIGLSRNTLRSSTKPSALLKKKFYILLSNPDFIKDSELLRVDFEIPRIGFDDSKVAIKWADHMLATPAIKKNYNRQLNTLLDKFQIGPRWNDSIEYYLIFNESNVDHLIPTAFDLLVEKSEDKQSCHLFLEIYKDTTLNDIKSLWSWIEDHKSVIGPAKITRTRGLPDSKYKVVTFDKKNKKIRKVTTWKAKRVSIDLTQFKKYKKAHQLKTTGLTVTAVAKQMGITYVNANKYLQKFKSSIENNDMF